MNASRRRVLGNQWRESMTIGRNKINRFLEIGTAVAPAKILPPAQVADDQIVFADDHDQEGRSRDAGQVGLTHGEDFARHDRDNRSGQRDIGVRVRGDRTDLRRQIAPR